jgi:hypothetical protein
MVEVVDKGDYSYKAGVELKEARIYKGYKKVEVMIVFY